MHVPSTLPYCFSSHSVNKCPLCGPFSATFLYFGAFCWWFSYLKYPQHSAEKLSSVPKHKAAWCALWRKHVVDGLHSCRSYSAVGHEWMLMNQQYIFSKVSFKQKHTKQSYYWSTDKTVVTRGSQKPNSVSPLGSNSSIFANSVFTATL